MLGERLKKTREENNVSQSELADFLGISQQALSKWENSYTEPNSKTLIKIANKFNVSVDYLLGNSESKKIDKPYEDELEKVLFSKAKELTDEEKKAVLGVINAIKRDVDNGKI